MATIRPFRALRPKPDYAKEAAALPYDVYSREEAREAVKDKPLSFLNIDRPETQFPKSFDMYDDRVYEKAADMLREREKKGIYFEEDKPCYYVYELVRNGKSQTGIAGCASVDDYESGTIKKHENTRKDKEEDRIRHVDALNAQSGPIFLAYRKNDTIKKLLTEMKKTTPIYDFTADDGIIHRMWCIDDDATIDIVTKAFNEINSIYIADGHHRAASAVSVSNMRRKANPQYTGEEEFNFFLSVLFADEELTIMDYNRVIKDVYEFDENTILRAVKEVYQIKEESAAPLHPKKKGEVGFYLIDKWYLLLEKEERRRNDPVEGMEVAYLQRELLTPFFGIGDPKTDNRIGFVGGIRGLEELVLRCKDDCICAFAMVPTSMEELFSVADAGKLMPPKSTWFEPKLRSGLLIHKI